MLESLVQITPLCFMIAVVSVVYMRILAYEPILSEWFKLGTAYGVKTETIPRSEQYPGGGAKLVYAWWYKPLFQCEKCLSGQIALWSYLVYMGDWYKGPVWFNFMGSDAWPVHIPFWKAPNYDLICHMYTICGSIALAVLLSAGYNIFKRKSL